MNSDLCQIACYFCSWCVIFGFRQNFTFALNLEEETFPLSFKANDHHKYRVTDRSVYRNTTKHANFSKCPYI